MIETGKLYLVKTHTTANIGQTAIVELKGNVSLVIYGTEEEPENVTDFNDLTPVSQALIADFYYPLDTLPKYIAFIGTADRINVAGYDLELIKDL